jgi:hypothetical protein
VNPVAITDALLGRIGRHVASIQITRFRKTTAGGVAVSVVDMFVGDESTDAPDHTVPAVRIMLTTSDGRIVDQCEISPIAGDVELVLFDRCLRAAWHWRLPLALNKERHRIESWDPRYPFAIDPSSLHVPWARDVLHRAGFQVTTEGERLTLTLDRTVEQSALDAVLTTPGAAIEGLKEGGLSMSKVKEKIRSARAEAKKGTRTKCVVTLDRAELRWSTETRPASDEIAQRVGVTRDGGAVATRDIAAFSSDGWGVLRAFGWGGYRDVTLSRSKDELRAIKHLLCAHAVGARA